MEPVRKFMQHINSCIRKEILRGISIGRVKKHQFGELVGLSEVSLDK